MRNGLDVLVLQATSGNRHQLIIADTRAIAVAGNGCLQIGLLLPGNPGEQFVAPRILAVAAYAQMLKEHLALRGERCIPREKPLTRSRARSASPTSASPSATRSSSGATP